MEIEEKIKNIEADVRELKTCHIDIKTKVEQHDIEIPKIHLILQQFSKAVDKFEVTVDRLDIRMHENDKQTAINASKQSKISKNEKIAAFVGGAMTILIAIQMILNTLGGLK